MRNEFVLSAFGFDPSKCTVNTLGEGLINSTWKVHDPLRNASFVIQQINKKVFQRPEDIEYNLHLLKQYLLTQKSDYLFIAPIESRNGRGLVKDEQNEYYRMFPFIEGSKTLTSLSRPEHAYEAARQFGKYTRIFSDFDATQLRTTIPDFHNLSMRFQKFRAVVEKDDVKRNSSAQAEIRTLLDNASIVRTYELIIDSKDFIRRVTHHDTKISNVLFDRRDLGIAVIDLDTTMPGFFISDVGDMMRTYLSDANEEEKDLDKVEVRPMFFEAIATGYLETMGGVLTAPESDQFLYSGHFLIYMQALRFLTDYLQGDVYYPCRFENHNLLRARNQIKLLTSYQRTGPELRRSMSRKHY